MKAAKNELETNVEYYSNLPYTITVERRDDQGTYYVARYVELRDLIMTGATPEEAVRELEAEKREWFEFNIKQGNTIPQPLRSRRYSGKIIVRMPPPLHEALTRLAEFEGVSFNQYMVTALARCAGQDEALIPMAGKKNGGEKHRRVASASRKVENKVA